MLVARFQTSRACLTPPPKAGPSGLQDPAGSIDGDDRRVDGADDADSSSIPSIEELPSSDENWDTTGSQTDRRRCANRGADTEAEEHVAVVAEPGGEYLTHFTPVSGKAINEVNELISIANCYGNNVSVLGCDGAAVNTGRSGSVSVL